VLGLFEALHPAGVAHLAAAQSGTVAGLLASLGAPWTLDLMVVVVGPGHLAWRLSDSLPAVVAGQSAQALSRDAMGGLLWLVMPLVTRVGWAPCTPCGPSRGCLDRNAARGLLFAFVQFLVSGGLLVPFARTSD
jgi:hypothetical protein